MALYAYPSCSTASLSFIRVPFCEQAARSSVFLAPPRSYSLLVLLLQRNLPPFLSLFRLFRSPLSLSLSLLVYIAACPTPLAPSLRTLSPPLPTLVPDVDPFRPVPVSLRSSSFSNSPRWHHRPLCSSLDAEERLNANHRAATGPWLFCLPREVWYVVMVWRSAVHPRKKRLHSLLWFRGLLSTEIRTAYERQTNARTTPAW